jgi:hypothetical protein
MSDPPTPTSVHFDDQCLFKAIDPGESEVISGYTPTMTFSNDDDQHVSPTFLPDIDEVLVTTHQSPAEQRKEKAKQGRKATFSMSGKEWRHLAGHNLVDQWRDRWRKRMNNEVTAASASVSTVTSQITTPKTVILEVYLQHLRTTFQHVDFLKKYHSKEHQWNFFKYRCEQKALCEVVKRVKGEDGMKKEKSQIIVAFGNGKFGNSGRKGGRGAPVERFKRHLRRHVTLVTPDEYRTSRVCSKCWMEECWDEVDCGVDGDTGQVLSIAHSLADLGESADDVALEEDNFFEEIESATEGQKKW